MKVVINIEHILVVSYGWLYFHFYRVTEISIEFMCQKELFSRSLNEFPYDVLKRRVTHILLSVGNYQPDPD